MNIHLVYFSPGGTTQTTVRNIAQSIADSTENSNIIEHNMLKKENRQKKLLFSTDDLIILGMMTLVQPFGPVDEIFKAIKGHSTPLVGVVLYGNGMYGNSLKVMRKQVEKRGFNMLAAGAFIGQMSYSDKVGTGRPDESDLAYHRSFGRKIAEKLKSGESLSIQKKLHTDYPKNTAFHWWKTVFLSAFPVGKVKVTRPLNRKAFTDACINCGKCEMQCPVGAIRLSEKYFDQKRCIGCVACVNNCPVKAIEITHKGMIKAAKDCESFFAERREPEFFL